MNIEKHTEGNYWHIEIWDSSMWNRIDGKWEYRDFDTLEEAVETAKSIEQRHPDWNIFIN